ncbi:hypothetical protein CVT24_003859 [Panaeolus cyanescens]|uniref:Retrotransposon gag domain-containing protein n=1 Tax=Panaeolus cyanescens TaxID=181874 RepID=A0A409YXD4_9AGAR|nr:hypothetical protein CVT24_003859 [Panaeolus cyanescens]
MASLSIDFINNPDLPHVPDFYPEVNKMQEWRETQVETLQPSYHLRQTEVPATSRSNRTISPLTFNNPTPRQQTPQTQQMYYQAPPAWLNRTPPWFHRTPAWVPQNPPPPTSNIGYTTTSPTANKELKMNEPPKYDGNRNQFIHFSNAVKLYLTMNRHIYNTDEKKLIFIPSYLVKGEAAAWREEFLSKKMIGHMMHLGLYVDFWNAHEKTFSPQDKSGDAISKLRDLKQGKKTADALITEFKLLIHKAGIQEDNAQIQSFMPILN